MIYAAATIATGKVISTAPVACLNAKGVFYLRGHIDLHKVTPYSRSCILQGWHTHLPFGRRSGLMDIATIVGFLSAFVLVLLATENPMGFFCSVCTISSWPHNRALII